MSQKYKDILFTTHAFERMKLRNIRVQDVYKTIHSPDTTFVKSKDNKKYVKSLSGRNHQVIATYKPDQKAYLVISAWVRGEEDKLPLVWRLITFPFKIAWWIIKMQFKLIYLLFKKLVH